MWRGRTRSWSLGRSPFRWTSSADVCAIFPTLGWTVNPLPFMSCGDLDTYLWACTYTRTSGRNCPGWSGTSRPWWRCSKVINFLYWTSFPVNPSALTFCRRPQRSWARPCCCASKSRKSFGVCTLLTAHTNKANIIVQLHLSVGMKWFCGWGMFLFSRVHHFQFVRRKWQRCFAIPCGISQRCFLHCEMCRDAKQKCFFCRCLQVCEMCRLYRSCAVQAVFGSLSCMTPHGSHFGPDHVDLGFDALLAFTPRSSRVVVRDKCCHRLCRSSSALCAWNIFRWRFPEVRGWNLKNETAVCLAKWLGISEKTDRFATEQHTAKFSDVFWS